MSWVLSLTILTTFSFSHYVIEINRLPQSDYEFTKTRIDTVDKIMTGKQAYRIWKGNLINVYRNSIYDILILERLEHNGTDSCTTSTENKDTD